MVRLLLATFLSLMLAASASPSSATIIIPSTYQCPLGGDEFRGQFRQEQYSGHEQAMGGTIVGPLAVLPIVQCPNGFLIARPDYSADEIAQNAGLIARPEFRSLREHPTYEQLWWLRHEQGADPYELAELRFLAEREISFGRYDDPNARARVYLQTIAALPFSDSRRFEWFRAYLRAVNILRQRKHFADARLLLSKIDNVALRPAGKQVRAEIQALSQLLAEGNGKWFPVTIGTAETVAPQCLEPQEPLTASELRRCATHELRQAMKQRCRFLASKEFVNNYPKSCHQFGRYDDIISPLAAALALLFIALTFRTLTRSETRS